MSSIKLEKQPILAISIFNTEDSLESLGCIPALPCYCCGAAGNSDAGLVAASVFRSNTMRSTKPELWL